MKLKDQVAIVTGSSSGIGQSIALAFAKEGANVVITSRNKESCFKVLDSMKEAYGSDGLAIETDISKGEQIKALIHATMDKYGKIDILVNNAGTATVGPLEETTEDTWDRVMGVDLRGAFLCSMAAGKIMIKQQRGNIINIASTAAQEPMLQGNAYNIAKAGVRMLTRLIAVEWGKHNIRANCISPGFIRTPMTAKNYSNPEHYRKRVEIVPLKRIGTPEDVANLALFLASGESAYINGEEIVIDGGFLHTVFQQVPKKPPRSIK